MLFLLQSEACGRLERGMEGRRDTYGEGEYFTLQCQLPLAAPYIRRKLRRRVLQYF